MTRRSDLTFACLDDVMTDVERLMARHVTVGQWSLGQILNHLTTAIRLTLEGHRRSTEPTREQEVTRRYFFRSSKFPEGMEIPLPILNPQLDRDINIEAIALRETIARFVSFDGELPAHPRLGPLTKEQWSRFHCMHCAHHLSFAVPVRGARA